MQKKVSVTYLLFALGSKKAYHRETKCLYNLKLHSYTQKIICSGAISSGYITAGHNNSYYRVTTVHF